MAIKRVFACDRCPHEEDAKKGARGSGVMLPDGAAILQWRKETMHLCKLCAVAMDGFMRNIKLMRNQSEAPAQKARGDTEFLAQKAIR